MTQRQLVGLAAYAQCLGLSIHRAYGDETRTIRTYFDEALTPNLSDLVSRLSAAWPRTSRLMEEDPVRAPTRGVASVLSAWSQWWVRGGVTLSADEAGYVLEAFADLDAVLDLELRVTPEVFTPIRLRCSYASWIMDRCIPIPVRRTRCIERWNQNPINVTERFRDLTAGADWMWRSN